LTEHLQFSTTKNLIKQGDNLLTNVEERYRMWSDAMMKAFIDGDGDKQATLWADNYKWMNIDAFGNHHTRQGKEEIRKGTPENWGMINPHLLKNELICANKEKGVFNAIIRWIGHDGKEWATNFIYVVTLDENDCCVSYTEWNVMKAREN